MFANIVVLASVYVLLALGYVIVYRSSRVLNFAHPEIFMVGGYLAFAFFWIFPVDPMMALPVAIIAGFIIGVIVYGVLMAPMAGHSIFAAVLVTIAFGIVIRGFALMGFQGQILYPGRTIGFEDQSHHVLGLFSVTTSEIFLFLSAVVVLSGLLLFFRYSSLGIRMRAASHDARLAAFRGINVHNLFALSWGIATGIAIYTSTLYSLSQQVNPEMTEVAIRGLAVALVGGMDSLKGTVPAALLVAALEIFTQTYVGSAASEAVPFFVLLIILLLRPWGLFGTKEAIDRV